MRFRNLALISAASAFALWTACKPVSCIDLDSWLGCIDRKSSSAFLGVEDCRFLNLSRNIAVDNPAIVVAFAVLEGREVLVDVPSESFGCYEVHRCSCNRTAFSKGNQTVVRREVF